MVEQIYKLSPHRDLQCYFLTPSAIAAMSQASDAGFIVSGKWRQQFDWAVVEWNRDNVFEHPALRYLPDGDLSGLTLTYQEQRTACIPIESDLYPVVSWDQLRLWVENGDGTETVYYVSIKDHATPIAGNYVAASATMILSASPGVGNRAGLALLEEHHYYTVQEGDELSDITAGIAADIQQLSLTFSATSNGASVTVTWNPTSSKGYLDLLGANGNRITMYGFAENGVAVWQEPTATFSGGAFPTTYEIAFDFANLMGTTDNDPDKPQSVPTTGVRKLRWTWAADMQPGSFEQTEFQVTISNWAVSGSNRQYSVAGPGSRRIEDTDPLIAYVGSWSVQSGNYSGSKIHTTSSLNDSFTIAYSETAQHQLFLGTRLLTSGANVSISMDGELLPPLGLFLNGEDVLIRAPLGSYGAGTHTLTLTNAGPAGTAVYFDFLEIAYPSTSLPDFDPQLELSLATDWDTYHSQSLPAERTAWLINKLGFQGRVNHYTGALWFYELARTGTQYASLTVTLTPIQGYAGSPTVVLAFAAPGEPDSPTLLSHLVLVDDTASNVAEALAALINTGTNLLWANTSGNQLILTARSMGVAGNGITVQLDPSNEGYVLSPASSALSGGVDGNPYGLDTTDPLNSTLIAAADYWRTDLTAIPRINRAARDWHVAYFTALKGYGMDAVASFSTELMNGDPSEQVGIAQRYPDGTPVVVNTPAVQTNFSPTATAFWIQTYLDMATLQAAAGMTPYLQAGEVQWWYFPEQVETLDVGMPFYDDYTQQRFQATYGEPMQIILSNNVDPAGYPNETAFLPGLIGTYTHAIRSALQGQFPGCRFEVLYPTDTNDTPLNQLINFPAGDWTPANLTCLKTESFTFTGNYNLDLSTYSMTVSATKGFPNEQRSHLVGISDSWSPWMKEVDIAQSKGLETVVLFALDQFCLIGYPGPPFVKLARCQRQG